MGDVQARWAASIIFRATASWPEVVVVGDVDVYTDVVAVGAGDLKTAVQLGPTGRSHGLHVMT